MSQTPEERTAEIQHRIERATPGPRRHTITGDLSVRAVWAHILAGVGDELAVVVALIGEIADDIRDGIANGERAAAQKAMSYCSNQAHLEWTRAEHAEARCRQLEQQAQPLVSALRALTEGMDRAGGDRDGMPECPWCQSGPGMGLSDDGESHTADCELLKARELLALLPPPGRDTP